MERFLLDKGSKVKLSLSSTHSIKLTHSACRKTLSLMDRPSSRRRGARRRAPHRWRARTWEVGGRSRVLLTQVWELGQSPSACTCRLIGALPGCLVVVCLSRLGPAGIHPTVTASVIGSSFLHQFMVWFFFWSLDMCMLMELLPVCCDVTV